MRLITICVSVFALLLCSQKLWAQGCSDAGVCSAGSMDPQNGDSIYSSLSISQTAELGEEEVFITSSRLFFKLRIGSNISFGLKAPFVITSGQLGNTAGMGDLTTDLTWLINDGEHVSWLLTAGIKIPGNSSDKTAENGLSLPMPYQTSLGSVDMLAGLSAYPGKWHFSVGYQHAFTSNENEFSHQSWAGDETAMAYFESSHLHRGDDLVFRVERLFIRHKSVLTAGLLPMFRLQKDRIKENGTYRALQGSDQLTLNLNMRYKRSLSEHLKLKLSIGNPILFRETRADGLTRIFVFEAGMEASF